MSLKIAYVRRGRTLARVRAELGIALENASAEVAERALQLARGLAPKKTGRYVRGLVKRRLGKTRWLIAATAPHSPYVEYSTRPHVIRPVRARALRFRVDGHVVFATRVRHPGTRGQHVLRRTAQLARSMASLITRAQLFRVVRR